MLYTIALMNKRRTHPASETDLPHQRFQSRWSKVTVFRKDPVYFSILTGENVKIIIFPVLFLIALSAVGELTPEDLDKIRWIVKEEVKREVSASEARLKEYVDLKIAGVDTKVGAVEKEMTWLMVLIVVAVGIPQILIAWRSRKDREQERINQELRKEIEALKQQRIVSP